MSLLMGPCIVNAQGVLSGVVKDESGKPLFGANIYEKGTTNGTISNADGQYTLAYKGSDALIVFSYVGYAAQEIRAAGQTALDVVMKQGRELKAAEVVGSRRLNRTATETPVAVDIIDVRRVADVAGQLDVNQLLQFAAPSFNSNKQSGADGSDHVDPATLRGLGPDQTLVLVNGKRRHQSSMINIYGTRGRGNTGTDLNAIPVAAIERIEILRDGASAQYGSDAIAGVINIVLKQTVDEASVDVLLGVRKADPGSDFAIVPQGDYDGATREVAVNYGVKAGADGFVNMTADYLKSDHTNRPTDPEVYDVYRKQFGDAASENFSFYANSEFAAGENARVLAFGGFNHRFTDAYAWSRSPDSDRNIPAIYPDGFDPHIQSVITDKSLSLGIRSKLKDWDLTVNNTYGGNRFHFIIDQTLNASLLEKSPTRFDAGGFQLSQNSTRFDLTRSFDSVLKGLNLAFGVENRVENYRIFAGEEGSYANYGGYYYTDILDSLGNVIGQDSTLRPSGSQGFPGFRPGNEVDESRNNIGVYADAELDVTEKFLLGVAARYENYSDFGSTFNVKGAVRLKLNEHFSLRAAGSTGFRAPSLAQLYYNTTFTNFIAGEAIDGVVARNNSPITRALGIPALEEEKSVNLSGGVTARVKALTLTVDAYSIVIRDRIVLTGTFYDDDPEIGADLQALNVGAAQFFTNAVNTTTTGVDAILTYSTVLAAKHTIRISFAGNFNTMTIDEVYTNDKLKGKEGTYFGVREQYFLVASAPNSKLNLSLDYTMQGFFASLRFTQFGRVELVNWWDDGDDQVESGLDDGAGGTYSELDVYEPTLVTDLTLGYKFKNVQASIGAANLLNVYPDEHDAGWTESGGNWDAVQMGFSGAFYFAKLGFRF